MNLKRVLFFTLCGTSIGAAVGLIFHPFDSTIQQLLPLYRAYCAEIIYGSLAAILLWSYLFLAVEIRMARIGIAIAIIELTALFLDCFLPLIRT
jgi:predicted membrane-bound spermidine synthase